MFSRYKSKKMLFKTKNFVIMSKNRYITKITQFLTAKIYNLELIKELDFANISFVYASRTFY